MFTAVGISGSFTTTSSSLASRTTTIEGNVGQAVNTTSNVQFNHITASGNISGSSTSTGSFGHLMVEGANFTSASLAHPAGGGSGTVTSIVAGNGLNGGTITSTGTISVDSASMGGFYSASMNNFTTTGNISGSSTSTGSFGRVEATTLTGDGSGLTGLSSAAISTYNSSGNDRIITSVNSSTVQGESTLTFNSDNQLTVTGQITASGNISSSGNLYGAQGIIGTSTAATNMELTVEGDISASGGYYGSRTFETGSITAVGNHSGGDIVYFGGGSLTTGTLYYLATTGTWTAADASDNTAGADELLGIALGSSATTNGVLLRGIVNVTGISNLANVGRAVYISTTAGDVTETAPSGNNEIVRIVGYVLNANDTMYFNPDSTWVKVTA